MKRLLIIFSLVFSLILVGHAAWAQTVSPNPAAANVAAGGTATIALVLDNATNLSAYNVTAALTGGCGATITNVSYGNAAGFTGVTTNGDIAADGRSVPVAAFAISPVTGASRNLGEITVSGVSAGTCTVQLTVNSGGFAANNGTLTVTGGAGFTGLSPNPQATTINNAGDTATIAFVLGTATNVSSYNYTVALSGTCGATITNLSFANATGFTGVSNNTDIAADGRSVPVAAFAVSPVTGANRNLGEVTVQGNTEGNCTVGLTVNSGGFASQNGTLDVVFDNTAPTISNPNPADGSTINNSQPTVSVNVQDEAGGSGLASVSLTINGPGINQTFNSASVDLVAEGVTLADGTHNVSVTATDNAGNTANFNFSFNVLLIVPGDVDGDGKVSLADSRLVSFFLFGLRALTGDQLVAADVALPCTGGATLDFADAVAIQQGAQGALAEFACFPGLPIQTVAVGASSAQALNVQPLLVGGVSLSTSSQAITFNVEGLGVDSVNVRVFGLDGGLVFDSGFQSGNALRWNMLSNDGELVANGVYLYVVTVKGLNGEVILSKIKKLAIVR